jgi:hypothetical protein
MVYTVLDLSKKIGITRASIYSYIKRGTLLTDNNLIDDEIEPNKTYFEKMGWNQPEINKKESEKDEEFPIRGTTSSITNKINLLKAAKINEDVKFGKLRNKKIEGELVRTDIVGPFVGEVVRRFKISVANSTEQLIRDICSAYNVSSEDKTVFLARLIDIINESSQIANVEAKKAIENSISDSLSLTK